MNGGVTHKKYSLHVSITVKNPLKWSRNLKLFVYQETLDIIFTDFDEICKFNQILREMTVNV